MIRHWYAVEEYTQTVYVFGQLKGRLNLWNLPEGIVLD